MLAKPEVSTVIASALTARVGRCGLSVETVAARLDCSVPRVKQMREGSSPPTVTQFVELCRILGADFADEVMEVYGFSVEDVKTPGCWQKLNVLAHRFALKMAERGGKVDHVTKAKLRPLVRKLKMLARGVLVA